MNFYVMVVGYSQENKNLEITVMTNQMMTIGLWRETEDRKDGND